MWESVIMSFNNVVFNVMHNQNNFLFCMYMYMQKMAIKILNWIEKLGGLYGSDWEQKTNHKAPSEQSI